MIPNPRFSIIVPVYNCERFLKECMDSIFYQDYPSYEVICVDDGSTDNSLSILREYENIHKNLIVISREHTNAGDARNEGLKIAKGDYVAFFDSDDYIRNDLLKKVSEILDKTNSDLVAYQAVSFDDKRKTEKTIEWVFREELLPAENPFIPLDDPDYIFQMFSTNLWNKVIRRSVLVDNDIWFSSLPDANDEYAGAMALVCATSIAYLKEPLYYYRCNTGGSIQSSVKRSGNSSYLKALDEIIDKLKEKQIYEIYKYSYIEKTIVEIINIIVEKFTEENFVKSYTEAKSFLLSDKVNMPSGYKPNESYYSEWYERFINLSVEELSHEIQLQRGDICKEYQVSKATFRQVYTEMLHEHNPINKWYKNGHGRSMTGIPLDRGIDDIPFKDLMRWNAQSIIYYSELIPYFLTCFNMCGLEKHKEYSLLDVGCGTGAGSNYLAQLFPDIYWGHQIRIVVDTTDVDRTFNGIVELQPFIRKSHNLDIFDIENGSYDFVFCSNVVERVGNPEEYLNKLRDISRKFVFVSCPVDEYDPINDHHVISSSFIESLHPFYSNKYKSVNRWRDDLEFAVFALK